MKIRLKSIFFALLFFLSVVSPVAGTVYFADHFDSHPDWVGDTGCPVSKGPDNCLDATVDTTSATVPGYSGYGYYNVSWIHVDNTVAHGGSGKALRIEWPQSMSEAALLPYFDSGVSEYWMGFWFKHSSWNWGGDTTYKWVRIPSANADVTNLNFQGPVAFILKGNRFDTESFFSTSDTDWHYVILYVKHNTTGNFDGEIRLWWDGDEKTFTRIYAGSPSMVSNTTLQFQSGDNVFDTGTNYGATGVGFQSRPDWGAGNISYFDDLVIATTRAEVEAFLAVGEATPGIIGSFTISGCIVQ